MGTTVKIFILIGLYLVNLIIAQDSTSSGVLIVEMLGFTNDAGTAKIALSDTKEDYNDHTKAYRGLSVAIANGTAQVVFENLAYGLYAVKVYHDANGNDKMDTNFMGIPQEAYGFSNEARGTFGPASWEDAKFSLNSDTLRITITIH
jgi:uncharacterized protein (DUF2141 family)